MRRARGLFAALLLLTASCGTFLTLGLGGDDEPPPAVPTPDDSSVDANRNDGSETADVDPRTEPDTGSGSRDAGRDADADADAAVDADAAPIPLDAAYAIDGSEGCVSCQTHFCTDKICDPLVFISPAPHEGDFTPSGDLDAGTSRPDDACQQIAVETGRKGRFRAWLAGTTGDQQGDHPFQRIKGFKQPYRLMDGRIVVATFDDFQGGQLTLRSPINMTPSGKVVPDDTRVWTGLTKLGRVATEDCNQWAQNTATGSVGIVNDCVSVPTNLGNCNARWSSAGDAGRCDELHYFYCIQSNESFIGAGP